MLILLYIGLTVEDLNLTENFSQENRTGEGKLNFMSLKNMSEAQSKVNSKLLLGQREESMISAVISAPIISFWTLLLF